MHKWLLPTLLILSLLLPLEVHAQDPTTFSSWGIQISPEYDKPSVLVIYNLILSATTTFPATVSVRIPADAGDPYAVADRQVDGQLYNLDYTRQVVGDLAVIKFTATVPEIRIEYYDPALVKEGSARHYQYVWPGDYSVDQLTIQVQQPFDATDMRISPSLGPGIIGDYNLTYYTQVIGAISAGQSITITVDYQKTSDALSAENLPVEPSAPIPQSTATDLNLSTWLPWVLGILGAGLIIGGIVWFWHTGRQRPVSQIRRRRSRAGIDKSDVNSSLAEADIYCSQCGKRALPGDQFCRSCGAAIQSR